MNFLNNFDINERADEGAVTEFTPIPAGMYKVVCEAAEETTTKSTGTEAMSFEWRVDNGEHKGRKLWDQLNVDHPNTSYSGREANRFRDICKSTGTVKPNSLGDFPGSECVAEVIVEPASECGTYKAKNKIKAYLPPVPQDSEAAPQAAPKRAGNSEWQAP